LLDRKGMLFVPLHRGALTERQEHKALIADLLAEILDGLERRLEFETWAEERERSSPGELSGA
jgi:hypothetical protein